MKKEIPFIYPFAGYSCLDFINCFTSTYMCIEGYDGTEDCYCGGKLKVCDSCGGCGTSIGKKQEELFFYFGTMSGQNALRDSFDGENEMQKALNDTDDVIDFLMRFTGYEYQKITENFRDAIVTSIHAGKPVLARMKSTEHGSFRVINGYDNDGDILICPEPIGAQRRPEGAPGYDELENLYIITGKTEPTVGMKEGFERIVQVMEYNRDNALWDGYIKKFRYFDELMHADFEEIRRRFKRVSDTMWYTFNCHNFAETFRRELYHKIENTNLRDVLYSKIDRAYDSTHNTAWQVIALNDCRDWSGRRYNELEWGMCNSVIMCLETLKKNDEIVLNAIKEAVEILKV